MRESAEREGFVGRNWQKLKTATALLALTGAVLTGCADEEPDLPPADQQHVPTSASEIVEPATKFNTMEDGTKLPSIRYMLERGRDQVDPNEVGNAFMQTLLYWQETGNSEAFEEFCGNTTCSSVAEMANRPISAQILPVTSLAPGTGENAPKWRPPLFEHEVYPDGFIDNGTDEIRYQIEVADGAYFSQDGRPYYAFLELHFSDSSPVDLELANFHLIDRSRGN